MARYQYVVMTQARKGRGEEFERWYNEQHLGDLLKVPGVVSAQRFRVVSQKVIGIEVPPWHTLALYELETDDPAALLALIKSLSGTDVMPSTESLDRYGMVQVVGEPVGEKTYAAPVQDIATHAMPPSV